MNNNSVSPVKRWRCHHCEMEGWSQDGSIPKHDRGDGVSCRPSGQKPESGAKKSLDKMYELERLTTQKRQPIGVGGIDAWRKSKETEG
jgi:hypothetical protein